MRSTSIRRPFGEKLEEMKQILAQPHDIALIFDERGLTVTAADVVGETIELGTLIDLTIEGASFTGRLNDGTGDLVIHGTLTKNDMQWKVDGEYRMTVPVSEDVTVTFVAAFATFGQSR